MSTLESNLSNQKAPGVDFINIPVRFFGWEAFIGNSVLAHGFGKFQTKFTFYWRVSMLHNCVTFFSPKAMRWHKFWWNRPRVNLHPFFTVKTEAFYCLLVFCLSDKKTCESSEMVTKIVNNNGNSPSPKVKENKALQKEEEGQLDQLLLLLLLLL